MPRERTALAERAPARLASRPRRLRRRRREARATASSGAAAARRAAPRLHAAPAAAARAHTRGVASGGGQAKSRADSYRGQIRHDRRTMGSNVGQVVTAAHTGAHSARVLPTGSGTRSTRRGARRRAGVGRCSQQEQQRRFACSLCSSERARTRGCRSATAAPLRAACRAAAARQAQNLAEPLLRAARLHG